MKVVLTETIERQIECEVTLPLYRRHDVDSDYGPRETILTRVDACNGRLRAIDIRLTGSTTAEIRVNEFYHFNSSSLDHALGRGDYASSPQEFAAALQTARALLDSVSV